MFIWVETVDGKVVHHCRGIPHAATQTLCCIVKLAMEMLIAVFVVLNSKLLHICCSVPELLVFTVQQVETK